MHTQLKYRHFLDKKGSYLFQQDWWLDTVYGAKNWDVILAESEGEITDALPYGYERKMGFRLIRPALLTPYLANIDQTDAGSLLALMRQLPPSSECIIAVPPIASLEKPFANTPDLNWQKKTTYLLPLNSSTDHIFQSFTHERKRHIKKAAKHLEIVDNVWDLNHFITWHQRSFANKKTNYPYMPAFIDQIVKTAQERHAVVCKQAFLEGKMIAQIACFYDTRAMYYLLGAYDDAYTYYNAMSLLMYACIQDAHSLQLEIFDFEGSSDPGIAAFFAKFGAIQSHYYILSKRPSLLWKFKKMIR